MSNDFKSDFGTPITSTRRAPVLMDAESMSMASISRLRFDCQTGVGSVQPTRPATAHAVVTAGVVTGIVIDYPGSDYGTAPTVTLAGDAGIGAVLSPVIANGQIQSITVTNGGRGYTAPTVYISGPVVSPNASLSWSDDGGNTWSNEYLRPMGDQGQYLTILEFRNLGIARRGRIFQLSVSDPVQKVFRSVMINR
jgi:hypothetical protein